MPTWKLYVFMENWEEGFNRKIQQTHKLIQWTEKITIFFRKEYNANIKSSYICKCTSTQVHMNDMHEQ